MPHKEFEATQGLLEDDMRRQAGSIEKSWLEAVMNAVDAGADKFEIFISEDTTEMFDDGSGIPEDEVDTYFQKFGYKDDDVEDKTYGRFRRGRGQIMNFGKNVWHTQDNVLVTDLDNDTTEVSVQMNLNPDDDSVVSVNDDTTTLVTEGNGFNHQEAQEYRDGTRIYVEHYKAIEDVGDKIDSFKKLVRYIPWMHNIEVYVNDEEVDDTFSPDFETEYAYFQYAESSYFNNAATYNLGAYVDDITIKDDSGETIPVSGVVISKEELQLNNARTEIIEGCDVWQQVMEDYYEGAKYFISKKSDITDKEAKWIIKQAKDDDNILELIEDRDIIKDIDGNGVSLEELMNNEFGFAPEGNAVAQEVMDRGETMMIDDSFKRSIRHLAGDDESGPVDRGQSYEEAIDSEMQFEMKERDEDNLSKRRKKNLRKIRWFLREVGCYDDVKPGFSKHEDVWRPDVDTILVDEDFLNSNKSKFATEVIDEVIRIAAAEQDTRSGFRTDSSYYRQYYRYMSKSTEPRQKVMEGREDLSSTPRLN